MNQYKLKDVAISQTGPFGSQLHEEDYVANGIPIVTVEHLGDIGFTTQNLPMVSEKDACRLKKYCLKKGDIVFSRVGSIDRNVYTKEDQEGWLFSGRCIRVRCDITKVNPRYLSFYFKLPSFKQMMFNRSVGATMPSLNTDIMDDLPLLLLNRNEQDKVAKILGGIDDKIENNNTIVAQLEALAKTIYDYWFVQFDFPDENGRPYKSSGGKMVWNERLQQEIPDGWETDILSSLAYFVTKKQDVGILNENNYISNDNLINDMGGIKPSQYLPNVISATEFITRDILLGNIRPYFRKMWLSDREGGCSADVLVIRAKNQILSEYLYYALGNKSFFDYDMAGSKGSKMPRGDKTHIMNFLICYREDLAIKFSEIVKPFITQISYLRRENQQLASLRDFLLPLLMNGQVSFKSDSI